jgi:phage terminase small subunit
MPAKSVYGLTAKQEEFAVAVAGGKSQSDAYRQAYDAENMTQSQIWVESSTLAKNQKVADRIAFLRNSIASETILKASDILNETRRMASVTARDFVHPDGTVKGIHELSDDAAACVSAIKVAPDGTVEYKLWDKNSAVDRGARIIGMYSKDNAQKNPLADQSIAALLALRAALDGNA